jgi:hypothetical protein
MPTPVPPILRPYTVIGSHHPTNGVPRMLRPGDETVQFSGNDSHLRYAAGTSDCTHFRNLHRLTFPQHSWTLRSRRTEQTPGDGPTFTPSHIPTFETSPKKTSPTPLTTISVHAILANMRSHAASPNTAPATPGSRPSGGAKHLKDKNTPKRTHHPATRARNAQNELARITSVCCSLPTSRLPSLNSQPSTLNGQTLLFALCPQLSTPNGVL